MEVGRDHWRVRDGRSSGQRIALDHQRDDLYPCPGSRLRDDRDHDLRRARPTRQRDRLGHCACGQHRNDEGLQPVRLVPVGRRFGRRFLRRNNRFQSPTGRRTEVPPRRHPGHRGNAEQRPAVGRLCVERIPVRLRRRIRSGCARRVRWIPLAGGGGSDVPRRRFVHRRSRVEPQPHDGQRFRRDVEVAGHWNRPGQAHRLRPELLDRPGVERQRVHRRPVLGR
ncbi:unannotated protein [freshwater metagenome]|uniref:Unannotated protein n=1 Tax=freshwater metagenome TaxID=449393 RepID=A0A6J7EDY9_9ZZZZ